MGNPFLLQACLRLSNKDVPKSLEIGKEYHFFKEGHRLYQLKVPMDLRTSDWTFLGRIVITEFTVGNGRTEGIFVFIKDFSEQDKTTISKTYVSDSEVDDLLK